ncbi:predicted protein [Lichtheimia corymbifera JMRC:FSU:9682]|uniref:Uncharacterized protein n=1 Tax=Lichtheimia corymbifera JMRC:FSU:9682 TaxID=1263082 RepID=A0A068SH63_9FUNG|nr:predicted protein [Lichtheimia corymbifera JMRC:FSU:9682]
MVDITARVKNKDKSRIDHKTRTYATRTLIYNHVAYLTIIQIQPWNVGTISQQSWRWILDFLCTAIALSHIFQNINANQSTMKTIQSSALNLSYAHTSHINHFNQAQSQSSIINYLILILNQSQSIKVSLIGGLDDMQGQRMNKVVIEQTCRETNVHGIKTSLEDMYRFVVQIAISTITQRRIGNQYHQTQRA